MVDTHLNWLYTGIVSVPALDLSILKPVFKPVLITDREGLRRVKSYLDSVAEFGFDLETNVTNDFTERKIRTIQIGDRDTQYVIDLLAFAGSTERLREQGYFQCPEWARDVLEVISEPLRRSTHLKVGYNLQFEYEMMAWNLGLEVHHFYCGFLAEKLINLGLVHLKTKGFWAMDDAIARYCNVQIDKTLQTSFDLESPLTQDQIDYAALDVRLSLAVKKGQQPRLSKMGLERVAKIEFDAIPAFGDMRLNGIYLDTDAWLDILSQVEAVHRDNVKLLDNYFLPVVGTSERPPHDLVALEDAWRTTEDKEERAAARETFYAARREVKEWEKNQADYEGEAGINYGAPHQVLAALRKMGYGPRKMPSTDDKVLQTLEGDPVIDALREYRTTRKQIDTYGKNWLDYINSKTGRIHSNINQIGADTGRTSSDNPNMQNCPRGSNYRGCFRSRPGYVFVSVDMSGAELRILGELSGEPLIVDAFAKGWDVHSVGAEMIFGDLWLNSAELDCAYYHKDHKKCKCEKHKKLRDQIKAINFGIVYGKEYKALAEELHITEDEAKVLLDKWRATYKVAWAYLQRVGQEAKDTLRSVSMSGRVRHYKQPDWEDCKQKVIAKAQKNGKDMSKLTPRDYSRQYYGILGGIERQGKNTPMQSGNADIAKLAMGAGHDSNGQPFMWHLLRKYDAKLVMFVHDEFDLEVREDQVTEVVEMVGDCIVRAGRELMKKVTMEYEAMIGDRWQK